METDKQYIQELRSLATSPYVEGIEDAKKLLEKTRHDKTLSYELHHYYEIFCSTSIVLCETFFPLYRVTRKIWEHGDNIPLDKEFLSEKFAKDSFNETFEKLQYFSKERIKKYIHKYFQKSFQYDSIYESIIGKDSHEFKIKMEELSKEDDKSVKEFRKRISRDYRAFRILEEQDRFVSIYNSKRMEKYSTEELLYTKEINLRSICNEEELKGISDLINLLNDFIKLCELSCRYEDSDCIKNLKQLIKEQGFKFCTDLIGKVCMGLFAETFTIFVISQPTRIENEIVEDLLNKSDSNWRMVFFFILQKAQEGYFMETPIGNNTDLIEEVQQNNYEPKDDSGGEEPKDVFEDFCIDKLKNNEEAIKKMKAVWAKLVEQKLFNNGTDGKLIPLEGHRNLIWCVIDFTQQKLKDYQIKVKIEDMAKLFQNEKGDSCKGNDISKYKKYSESLNSPRIGNIFDEVFKP
jgi:hypothetical protein